MNWEPLSMTRAARKHRVGSGRIRAALADAGEPLIQEDGALFFIGNDERGEELEVVLVPDERHGTGWVIIHAMPTKYRKGRQ